MIFSLDGAPGTTDLESVAVHEVGHLLGLDHTAIVSATMNPQAGSGVTFFRALQTDDRIACSVLYPAPGFTRSTGELAGRVLLEGSGVYGAHVVAMDEAGRAVTSALSGKDGSYRISGLGPGSYSLYAEPLDGPVMEDNILKPRLPSGLPDPLPFDTRFATAFLGKDADNPTGEPVSVAAGDSLTDLDISVSPAAFPHLNLTGPRLGTRLPRGRSESIRFFGDWTRVREQVLPAGRGNGPGIACAFRRG